MCKSFGTECVASLSYLGASNCNGVDNVSVSDAGCLLLLLLIH